MFELVRRNPEGGVRRYDPFRMMDAFFAEPFGRVFGENRLADFRTDIRDEGDSYLLEADLPGFDKKDIRLDLNGDILTIHAERHTEEKNYLRCERSYGSYSRSFDISQVDAEGIKAKYKDGVLRLTLPKKQETLPASRQLEIE
jgi:HSP20 family protein